MRRVLYFLIAGICVMFLAVPFYSYAETDSDTWHVYITDGADLLSDDEEQKLFETMKDGVEYGNMVFITIDDAMGYTSSNYIEMLYQTSPQLAGTDAVVYMIDMDNRMLWITGYGDLKITITPDYANLITDNVYRYASNGDYARCANEGYKQITTRLAGQRVAGSLRTMGNLSIAVIFAAVICFLFAYMTSSSRRAEDKEIIANVEKSITMADPRIVHTRTQRIYDPVSSGSGGGGGRSGGGGFSGGGGGGGGFSGGGGGHGF